MIRIETPVLRPVIELSPADFGERIQGLQPIGGGAWLHLIDDVVGSPVFEHALHHQVVYQGLLDEPAPDELGGAIQGGWALYDGDELVIAPQCCGDLSDLHDWKRVLLTASSDWDMLWIGHPWLQARTDEGHLLLEETQESNRPLHPRQFRVTATHLKDAIHRAEARQQRLARTVRRWLADRHAVLDERATALADCLTGATELEAG